MSNNHKCPMPNDRIVVNGTEVTVVASVHYNDMADPPEWLVLCLRPIAPFFLVMTFSWSEFDVSDKTNSWVDTNGNVIVHSDDTFYNIVEAVRHYEQSGGDI